MSQPTRVELYPAQLANLDVLNDEDKAPAVAGGRVVVDDNSAAVWEGIIAEKG
jgi:hypothetical protein